MAQEVELPDGRILEFPDGMSQDDMAAAVRTLLDGPASQAAPQDNVTQGRAAIPAGGQVDPPRSFMHALGDNIIGFDDGVQSPGEKLGTLAGIGIESATFGLIGDEANARADDMLGRGDYDERLDFYRGNEAQMRADHPVLSTGADLAGGIAVPGGAVKMAGRAGLGLLARMGVGGAAAATGAGTYGFMEGEGGLDNRMDSGMRGAAIGGLLGMGLPAVGSGVMRAVDRVRQNRAVNNMPSIDDLRSAASRIYDQADNVTNLPRAQFGPAAAQAQAQAQRLGADQMLTPSAARVVDNMGDVAANPDPAIGFRELDILRRQASIPAGDMANRPQAAIGATVIDAVDDFVDAVDPKLSGQLAEAREMWGRMRRNETINAAIEKARNQASGFENGLRTQFRALLNNQRAMRGFSAAEKDAIREVVQGTRTGNLMRQVGRMGISFDGGSNAMGAMVSGGLGGAALGPAGLLIPVVASGVRKMGEMSTRNAARRAQGLIASGAGQFPAISQAAQGGLLEQLSRTGRGLAIAGQAPQ